jgi:hypothetical protein
MVTVMVTVTLTVMEMKTVMITETVMVTVMVTVPSRHGNGEILFVTSCQCNASMTITLFSLYLPKHKLISIN